MLRRVMMAPSGGGGSDPYWADVAALLHLDGTDGGTVFTDQKGNTWVASGGAEIDTSQSKFGPSSLAVSTMGDYISTSIPSPISMGDFTWDCYFRPASPGAVQPLIACSSYVLALSGNNLVLRISGVNRIVSTDVVSAGEWRMASLSRASGVAYLFLDGVLQGTFSSASNLAVAMQIGKSGGFEQFNGHIDEVRVTRGVARYTSSFAPPAGPFPNS